ncbi:hypothetical protein [Streptomyces sp. HC307]|uniref:hypothetical protein n=1 Tax=Streptomyces flavusporus TaxID=3385496 RepID=UPI0039171872
MIVFPRLLVDLLDQVDQTRAAHLALDFVQHVLDIERDEIAESVLAACLEYIAAAHESIDLDEAHPGLFQARERLWEAAARWDVNRYVLARGAGPTLEAARVGTERLVDKAAGRGPGTPLPCLDVARELQAEVGRWYAKRIPDGADERLVARRARWEEARWQVQHVIATEPSPHGDKDSTAPSRGEKEAGAGA